MATPHFLSGTIAGVRSKLRRSTDTPTFNPEYEHVTMRLHVLAADACYVCGGTVEDGLARLGSILCHDCRRGHALRDSTRP